MYVFTLTQRAIPPTDPGASRYLRKAIKSSDTGEIIMRNIQEDGWNAIEVGPTARDTPSEHSSNKPQKDKPVRCFGTRPVESFEILNDLVVDRGPSPFVSMLEVFADNNHLTTAQADGLCVSTPTGSTAYSLSAGGSLVYPDIPAILITPICPHTLSFRPMLLPDSMELRIAVPYHSRSNAWASFDGRGRIEIKRGDHIKVTASPYPFPAVCPEDQPYPWFDSVSRTLNWNQRQKQKSFVMVEEHVPNTDSNSKPTPGGAGQRSTTQGRTAAAELPARPKSEPPKAPESASSSNSDVDSESEEEYDIDDRSTAPVSRTSTIDRTLSEPSGSMPSVAAAMRRDVFSSVQPMTSLSSSINPAHDLSTPDEVHTPSRFGSGGPPKAPPLSRRHLAAVNHRLTSSLRPSSDDAARSGQPAASESGKGTGPVPCSQAIVVYGHDDTDDSESSEA